MSSNPNLFGDLAPKPVPPAPAQTQSLYRKYRPRSFDSAELVGQEHIVKTLRNAIHLGRVAHAYLFCGPRGTGKTTTARLLAKAVNCLNPDVSLRPCNACASCIAINTGATSDVIEIDAASNRGIDDIRDLRERVKYAPTQLQTKFYIIDEAHQITGAAANAFLKTLEEPPPHTKFVLATTDPEELLQTIVSRCQRFDFRRITLEAMISRLKTVAKAEHLTVTDDALAAIARHATGSLRDALGLLDQLAVYGEDEGEHGERDITLDSVLKLLGVSKNERVEQLVRSLAENDVKLALSTVNEAIEAGEDVRQLNRQLVSYLRVLLHERAGGSPDADTTAKQLALRFELPRLSRLARIFSENDFKIRHSPYAQLPLELALVDAIAGTTEVRSADPAEATPPVVQHSTPTAIRDLPPTTSLRDRVRGTHLQVVPPTGAPRETPPASETPTPPAIRAVPPPAGSASADGELSVELLADLWPHIRNGVKLLNRRYEALLASIDPVAVSGNTITLASAYEFHRNRVNEDDVRRTIEGVVSDLVKRPVSIHCILRGEMPPGGTPPFRPSTGGPSSAPPSSTAPASPSSGGSASPAATSLGSEPSADERRFNAAKIIFDAEEVADDD